MRRCSVASSPTTVRSSSAAKGVEVDLVAQPFGECVGGQLRVIAAPVEAPIDGTLDRATDGLEQGKRDKRRGCDGERLALGHTGERRLEPNDEDREGGHEQAAHERPSRSCG